MRARLWRVKRFDARAVAELSVQADISPLLAHLLIARGVGTPEDALAFLHPSPSQLHDPFGLPNMRAAVNRLRNAVDAGERIIIYGDYDVDGTTSTALLLGVLRGLGADVDFYIPDRLSEGYGMNVDAMRDVKERGADVLLTVDCGITAQEPIEEAHRLGIDVIVTDHHSIDPQRLPKPDTVVAVVDPKLEGHAYPFRELAGVGLAFKVAQALVGGGIEGGDPVLVDQLDLVALGTIADVAVLRDENRALARLGLAVMNRRTRPGIRALCEVAVLQPETPLASYHIGFVLGPRINAAGRLDTAHKVVDLLTTDSDLDAFDVATRLNEENDTRRGIERQMTDEAVDMVQAQHDTDHEAAIVVAREGWHAGVVGLVASRLTERFWRPTIAIALDGDTGRGSGRSIPEFDLHAGLLECRDCMITFGGHAAAAGMTLHAKSVGKLREMFHQVARSQLTERDLRPKLDLEAILPLDNVTLDAIEEMSLLEPFGAENPAPRIGLRGLQLAGRPYVMGKDGRHLSASLTDGTHSIRAIAWDGADFAVPLKAPEALIGVAGRLEVNEYQGRRSAQIVVRDWDIKTGDARAEREVYPSRDRPTWVRIVDKRREDDKAGYLSRLVERDEPMLIVVRSDYAVVQARDLLMARALEQHIGHCPQPVTDEARHEALRRFWAGEWRAFITTAIPLGGTAEDWEKLRHTVFCHAPYDEAAYLAACGPAVLQWSEEPPGPEDTRSLHLLFNQSDVDVDRRLVFGEHPNDEALRRVYRGLLAHPGGATESAWRDSLRPEDVPCLTRGIVVFEELGLIEHDGGDVPRYLAKRGRRRELTDSPAFRQDAVTRRAWELQAMRWIKQTPQDFWELLHTRWRSGGNGQ